jgi:hypothetical protein
MVDLKTALNERRSIMKIDPATISAIESANLTGSGKYLAWMVVSIQQHLAECPQPKPLESWSLTETLEFVKACEEEESKPAGPLPAHAQSAA